MQLSETIKLYPTRGQKELILSAMSEYIATVNSLVSLAVSGTSIKKFTTADVKAELPSALINQCIRDAKSIVQKYYKMCHRTVLYNIKLHKKDPKAKGRTQKLPVLKRPCIYVNNQNYRIDGDCIEFPVMLPGRQKRISVRTRMTEHQKELLSSYKLGTMRVVIKNNDIIAQPVYDIDVPEFSSDSNVMGVDLGIKCPAVSYTSNSKVQFFGNGRQNKYMRRHYDYLRKKLQKAKKLSAVKRINNKEQRIMKDIDHKISRSIINTAIANNVSVIKLECLENIRSTTRKSRKNNHSLHGWSFYRLAQFIEYKARLAGISVEFVNPAYTSQRCPICGKVHHADDRDYRCECGYHIHRDILGAINICNSTEYVGNRRAA